MDALIGRILSGVRLGEPTSANGLTLIPVISQLAAGPAYHTLAEAILADQLVISEVDGAGSVPQLRARNSGSVGVLILDGEELRGAKQNRVLNTTVYLAPDKVVLIPVSCVEAGRWHSTSERFADSGYVASQRVRCAAKESVTMNLRASGSFCSDQGRVWDEVAELAADHSFHSPTQAMRDVYESRRDELTDATCAFPAVPGQRGLVAVCGGRVFGMDLVSREEAYAQLHERLVRSYLFEAMRDDASVGADDLREAKRFMVSLADAVTTSHPSPGNGTSHRFTGPGFVGDALTYRGAVLHAAFFAAHESRTVRPGVRTGMASARARRARRTADEG